MSRVWSLLVALSFSSLCLVFGQTGGQPSDGTNIVTNGSFEQGNYAPNNIPDGWYWNSFSQSAVPTWDESFSKTGNRSAKITSSKLDDAWFAQNIVVQQHRPYSLSGWIKTENVAHTPEIVDNGANLSLVGGFTHAPGVLGTQDWTRTGLIFNSESNTQITIAARLGFYAGTTTGTAWFDNVRLVPLIPTDPHPRWKILVLIYRNTDFAYVDAGGVQRHAVASMKQTEVDEASNAATLFVEEDIPALTSGNMIPTLEIRYPQRALTHLSPIGGGWWPSPEDTVQERDPDFDSVIVIWDPRSTDQNTGQYIWIGSAAGLTPSMGTGQTYATLIIEAAFSYGHRNVFKHEWGHSILEFFDSIGTAPKPKVENHAVAKQYVNCLTGLYYVWVDETNANPIPDSIYNNNSGFTHDYYSGLTATADAPTRCLGINRDAWSYGGPVSNSSNLPALPITRNVNDKVNFVVESTSYDPEPIDSGPAGVLTINAILTNESSEVIMAPIRVIVATLTGGNILVGASGDGSAGSKQAVDAGSDDALIPAEHVQVQLRIGLSTKNEFTFLVDVEGGVLSPDEL